MLRTTFIIQEQTIVIIINHFNVVVYIYLQSLEKFIKRQCHGITATNPKGFAALRQNTRTMMALCAPDQSAAIFPPDRNPVENLPASIGVTQLERQAVAGA